MRLSQRGRTLARLAAAIALVALTLSACKDSPTQPPTLTQTPIPSNVAGAWIGFYVSNDLIDCGAAQAYASLHQNGSTVTGILNTNTSDPYCGFTNETLQGTLEGTTLRGTIAGDYVWTNGEVDGTFSGATLVLNLRSGIMNLHR